MFRVRGSSYVVVAVLCCAASPMALAQSAAAPGETLTLEAALERAEAQSPLLRLARAEHQTVAARDVGASLLLPSNPVVSAGFGPSREEDGRRGFGSVLHAEQTIEIGGQRGTRRGVVSRAVRTAELRVEVARAETRARVRAAYVGAQLARARVQAASEREALVTRMLDAVKARVAGGASSNVDLELARLERGSAARHRVDAQLAAADALAQLRRLVGLPPSEPVVVEAVGAAPSLRSNDLAAMIARAKAQRADLAAVASTGAEIDADIIRLRREIIPSPTVFVSLERERAGQYLVTGGVGIPIPVWRRNQGELALARAERSRVDEERAVTERDVALEVERAFLAEKAQREMVDLLARDVLPAADATITLMTEGWRAGKFDLFRLIQTSRDATEAKRLYLETLGLLWDSAIELDRAMGMP
jgi:outer membrane protein, heavy metal efflux system